MQSISMLMGVWETIGNIVSGFFAIIPQSIYFLFASAASVLDMLQYAVRKLAGLDVYYVDGEARQGDIITQFIEGALGINDNYSIFSTVFWAMIIFGVVLLVFSTIIAMIRAHYDYNAQKSAPSYIIGKAIRGLLTMVIIPVVTIFSLYLSEIVIKTLDTITSGTSTINFEDKYEQSAFQKFKSVKKEESGTEIYGSFDFFGGQYWTNSMAFSSVIFSTATHNANRVRTGAYGAPIGETNNDWDNLGVFWTDNANDTREVLATQIDTAFKYCLTLKEKGSISLKGSSESLSTSYSGLSSLFVIGIKNVKTFSRFDVGLVWYYYNLWSFDYFLGFAGIITSLVLLFNIILGLISRILYCFALFLVYPPITGLFPFDEGNAVKTWRTSFTKMYISAYGAVVALNVMTIILPFLQTISLFNNVLLDNIVNSLFVITGLIFVKKAIGLISSLIGAENIEEVGAKMAKDFQGAVVKGVDGVMKIVGVGLKANTSLANTTKKRFKKLSNKVKERKIKKHFKKKGNKKSKLTQDDVDQYYMDKYDEKKEKYFDGNKEEKDKIDKNWEDVKNGKGTEVSRASYMNVKRDLEQERPEIFKEGGLHGDKELDTTKMSQEEYEKLLKEKFVEKEKTRIYDAKVDDDLQKKADKKKKIKDFIANRFYQPAETGEDGKPKKRKLKKGIAELLDIGGKIFKLEGELTGISGFGKALSDAGIVDSLLSNVKEFAKTTGLSADGIKTSKDKEKEKEKQEDEDEETVLKGGDIAEETHTAISTLATKFASYYKTKLAEETAKPIIKKDNKPGGNNTPGGDDTPGGGGSSGGGRSSGGSDDSKKDNNSTNTSGSGGATAGDDEIVDKKARQQRRAKRRVANQKLQMEKVKLTKQQREAMQQMIEMAEARKKEKESANSDVEQEDSTESLNTVTDEPVEIDEKTRQKAQEYVEKEISAIDIESSSSYLIKNKIESLKEYAKKTGIDISEQINKLEETAIQKSKEEEEEIQNKERLVKEKEEKQNKIKSLEREIDKKENLLSQCTMILNGWRTLRQNMDKEFEQQGHSDRWLKYYNNEEPIFVRDMKDLLKRFGVKEAESISMLNDFESFATTLEKELDSLKLELKKISDS